MYSTYILVSSIWLERMRPDQKGIINGTVRAPVSWNVLHMLCMGGGHMHICNFIHISAPVHIGKRNLAPPPSKKTPVWMVAHNSTTPDFYPRDINNKSKYLICEYKKKLGKVTREFGLGMYVN